MTAVFNATNFCCLFLIIISHFTKLFQMQNADVLRLNAQITFANGISEKHLGILKFCSNLKALLNIGTVYSNKQCVLLAVPYISHRTVAAINRFEAPVFKRFAILSHFAEFFVKSGKLFVLVFPRKASAAKGVCPAFGSCLVAIKD